MESKHPHTFFRPATMQKVKKPVGYQQKVIIGTGYPIHFS